MSVIKVAKFRTNRDYALHCAGLKPVNRPHVHVLHSGSANGDGVTLCGYVLLPGSGVSAATDDPVTCRRCRVRARDRGQMV